MKTYYHVTKKSNFDNISKKGLIPQIGELSSLCDEELNRVYLFPAIEDMETALGGWLGEYLNDLYGENEEFCSLQIEVPDDFPIVDGDVEYEVYCYQTIPSKYIKYLRDE